MLWKAIGGKHPYAFYTALRWVCFSVFFCSVIAIFRMTPAPSGDWLGAALLRAFGALVGVLAVLFNPFFEFHFRRETWRVIDIVAFVCVSLLILVFYGRFEELPAQIKRAAKLIIWFFAAGLVAYYVANEAVHLYGKYVLATASTTATVFEVDEEALDSEEETRPSGVKYRGI
jgi:phosphoglycerol transferase MdoB-like AlkP superfamily enzyme